MPTRKSNAQEVAEANSPEAQVERSAEAEEKAKADPEQQKVMVNEEEQTGEPTIPEGQIIASVTKEISDDGEVTVTGVTTVADIENAKAGDEPEQGGERGEPGEDVTKERKTRKS